MIRTEEIKNSTFLISVDEQESKEFLFKNNPGYLVIKPIKIKDGLSEGVHRLQIIAKPTDNTKPARHEIVDFLIAGHGAVGIKMID